MILFTRDVKPNIKYSIVEIKGSFSFSFVSRLILKTLHQLQGSQQDEVKFQDQLFAKFQDIFRPQAAKYSLSKRILFSLTKIIHEHHY